MHNGFGFGKSILFACNIIYCRPECGFRIYFQLIWTFKWMYYDKHVNGIFASFTSVLCAFFRWVQKTQNGTTQWVQCILTNNNQFMSTTSGVHKTFKICSMRAYGSDPLLYSWVHYYSLSLSVDSCEILTNHLERPMWCKATWV